MLAVLQNEMQIALVIIVSIIVILVSLFSGTKSHVRRGIFAAEISHIENEDRLGVTYKIPKPKNDCYYLTRLSYHNSVEQLAQSSCLSGDVGSVVIAGSREGGQLVWDKHRQGVIHVHEVTVHVCEISEQDDLYATAKRLHQLQNEPPNQIMQKIGWLKGKRSYMAEMKELDSALDQYFSNQLAERS